MGREKLDKDFESKLVEALMIYRDFYCEAVDAAMGEEEVTFSANFEKCMDTVIRRQRRGYYNVLGSAAKKFAVAIACAILLTFAAAMSIEASRNAIIEFFTEVYEKFSVVFITDKSGDVGEGEDAYRITKIYKPTYVPEGYELDWESVTKHAVRYGYTNGNKEIYFVQAYHSTERKYIIDTEESQMSVVTYNGVEYRYIARNDMIQVIWYVDNYAFYVMGDDINDLVKIADSTEYIDEI